MGEARQIARVSIERDADLVFARQRARDVAELIGFSEPARARFTTAVSEVARRSLHHGGSAAVFSYRDAPAPALAAELSYGAPAPQKRGNGVDALEERRPPQSVPPPSPQGPVDWLDVAAMLVDSFEVADAGGRTHVTITMRLPNERAPLTADEILGMRELLSRRSPGDAVVELQRQNRELLDALDRVGRAERATAQALRERQTLLALIPDVVWTARADGFFDYFSPRWRELTGLSDVDSEGQGWLAAVEADDRESTRIAVEEAIARGEPFDVVLRLRDRDGAPRWHLVRGVPLCEQGTVAKWFGCATDIDDAKRREQEAARVASYMKRIVSVVGHDLRAPLSVVLAAANMLEITHDPAVTARMIGRMKGSVERAGRMIGDLLDYTRVELGGGLPAERKRCDVGAAVNALVEQARLAHSNHRFMVEVAGSAEAEVDADRVVQAVSNLLENAAAHTPANEPIIVIVSGEAERLRLIVKNRGPVVAPELLAQVFEPFCRAGPRSPSRGLGLGLYIVSEIARSHGGGALMTSSERDGTAVEISLPRA